MSRRALLIVYPGATLDELWPLADLMTVQGSCIVATPDGTLSGSRGPLTDLPVVSFSDVDPAAGDIVAIAGGDIESVYEDDRLFEFLRASAEDEETTVGGICNGAWLLARAGTLRERRCTHTCREEFDAPAVLLQRSAPDFEGSEWIGEAVVRDRDVVTALPFAAVDFAVALGVAAGLFEHDATSRREFVIGRQKIPARVLVSVDDTEGRWSVLEMRHPPGTGAPLHYHRFETEGFHVAEGAYEFVLDDERFTLRETECTRAMPEAVHGFANRGDGDARMLFTLEPGRAERYFVEMAEVPLDAPDRADRIGALDEQYGMVMVPRSGRD